MKSLKLFLFVAGILIAGRSCAFAQYRAEKTSSAKAYYGEKPEKPKMKKKKKQKVTNYTHTRPAKGTRADAWSTKKKYS
jgi:hypothetical protein